MQKYSLYYQATVQKELGWMVTSVLRFTEHVAFDRTLDKESCLFEFFVSPDLEFEFLNVMNHLAAEKVIFHLTKLPNRYKE